MLKLGLIGCGRIMESGHVPALKALSDQYQVAALADPSEERTKVIGEAIGVEPSHRYSDYRRMLEKERLDVVDIATPHFLHKDPAVAAAQAKVNVITEKPLARNLEEADQMLAACKANNVRLAILHNYRYGSRMRQLIDIARSGRIGRLFMCRVELLGGGYYHGTSSYDPTWRADERGGGGCLIDNGYHWLYIFREVMNSPITSAYARAGTFYLPIKVEDLAAILFGHESGGVFSLQTAWSVKSGGQGVIEAYGTEGTISLTRFEHRLGVFDNATGEWSYPEAASERGSDFQALFAEIAAAFQNDKPLLPDGMEARRNLEAVVAAYESARTGKVIKLRIPPPGA